MKNILLKLGCTIAAIGVITYSATLYIPSYEILGADMNNSIPECTSLRLSNVFSKSEEFESVDILMTKFLSKYNIAGASLAISKNDKLYFAKGYGYADKELKIETEPYNLFRIASISKLITAVGIMKLVESNQLTLESKVFGPEGILNDSIYLHYIDPRFELITVKHLLEHSGGWTPRYGDHMFMPSAIAAKLKKSLPVNMDDIIRFALMYRLHFQPGSHSSYSNLGYGILGQVIEKITGLDYELYIKNEVLFPIGIFDMKIAGSFISERNELEVKYYEPDNTYLMPDYLGKGEMVSRTYGGNDMRTLGPAGGWIASSTDLMKLMLSINGDSRFEDILSKESIYSMIHPDCVEKSPLGWKQIRTDSTWIRTGTLASVSAQMAYGPTSKVSWVLLLNSGTWKGPEFSGDVYNQMSKVINQIYQWPEYNLFDLKVSAMSPMKHKVQLDL